MPSPRDAHPQLLAQIQDCAEAIEKTLSRLIPNTDLPENILHEAMRYSSLGGGKRLRPFMLMQSSKLFGVDPMRARRAAAALEMVHSYSLIHDDLPAMDNSPMRRGKASCHMKFDEATAILAGDALLTQAFEVITDSETHEDPRIRIELVQLLSRAAGPHGMVGGQMLDMIGETKTFDLGTISRMQRMKTGMLMAFACEAGAVLGRASTQNRKALRNYAYDLGLAFQVTDDILDIESDPHTLGKPANQDEDAGKSTFVTTMGKEQAKQRSEMLVQQAVRHLNVFDEQRAETLKEFATYVLERRA